jgi:sugar phosphate isomerase/epimerase
MKLGIDSFSVRWHGWNAFQIMDYAASLGLENVHFSERDHLGGLDPAQLEEIRRYASERNLSIEVGMRSFNRLSETFNTSLGTGEQQLTDMIQAATIVGSPIVRCFVGMQSDRNAQGTVAELIAETIRVLTAVAPAAESAGVAIAVENHGMGDLLAHELRHVIETVASPFVRVCLDTGNPAYAGEDPVHTAELLAPYTITTHLRDTLVWLDQDDIKAQWAPVGKGNVDFARIVDILQREAPAAPIDFEIITGVGPATLPVFDPASEFWRRFPDMPAAPFARFIALARRGPAGPIDQHELPAGVWQPNDEYAATFLAQQLAHFEESLTYFRNHLLTDAPVSTKGSVHV